MTISQIESFLTLADTLNYTKASSLLHTTQPNLSKMIMNIEQEVGVQLLIRNKRDVKLTQAGIMFYREMDSMMAQYRRGLSLTRLADSGVNGIIRVGFLGTAMSEQLPKIVKRFTRRYPDVRLELVDYSYSKLTELILEGELDVALVMDKELERQSQIIRKPLFSDDMCLVVRKDHRLYAAQSVKLKMVSHEKFIVMDKRTSQRDYELVSNICYENDFLPQINYECNTLNNVIMMVECGMGISILARHMKHYATEHVVFLPIEGYESYFQVSCAYREGNNACVPKLLEVLGECRELGELRYSI